MNNEKDKFMVLNEQFSDYISYLKEQLKECQDEKQQDLQKIKN
jgi:hypothetical protein